MAWNLETGDLRILDIPADFTQAEAHAISGTTAVGQVWTAHGEVGRPVAWDTATGAVRILDVPDGHECGNPQAISRDTVVGTRCFGDNGVPIVWSPLTAGARDLDLLPSTQDGVPRAVDGTTAVGWCCIGEEGTPLPLIWDTVTGAVRQLALPAPSVHGKAAGVSGTVAVGSADAVPVVWDLGTGEARHPAAARRLRRAVRHPRGEWPHDRGICLRATGVDVREPAVRGRRLVAALNHVTDSRAGAKMSRLPETKLPRPNRMSTR